MNLISLNFSVPIKMGQDTLFPCLSLLPTTRERKKKLTVNDFQVIFISDQKPFILTEDQASFVLVP